MYTGWDSNVTFLPMMGRVKVGGILTPYQERGRRLRYAEPKAVLKSGVGPLRKASKLYLINHLLSTEVDTCGASLVALGQLSPCSRFPVSMMAHAEAYSPFPHFPLCLDRGSFSPVPGSSSWTSMRSRRLRCIDGRRQTLSSCRVQKPPMLNTLLSVAVDLIPTRFLGLSLSLSGAVGVARTGCFLPRTSSTRSGPRSPTHINQWRELLPLKRLVPVPHIWSSPRSGLVSWRQSTPA